MQTDKSHLKMDPEQLRAHLERRRSNASGYHPHRGTKRNRSRNAQRRNAIKEGM